MLTGRGQRHDETLSPLNEKTNVYPAAKGVSFNTASRPRSPAGAP